MSNIYKYLFPRLWKLKQERNLNELRKVYINDSSMSTRQKFVSNYVKTTKYTVWTFLPKTLFEQFRRIWNLFILTVAVINLIPTFTVFTPITSISPLLFVLGVAAVKEAIEDRARRVADKLANNKPLRIIRDGQITMIRSRDLLVGDLLNVRKGEEVSADITLLWTGREDGVAYTTTVNLDGETNLKLRRPVPATENMTREELEKFKGVIVCEPPNNKLYSYLARMLVGFAPGEIAGEIDTLEAETSGASPRARQHGSVEIERKMQTFKSLAALPSGSAVASGSWDEDSFRLRVTGAHNRKENVLDESVVFGRFVDVDESEDNLSDIGEGGEERLALSPGSRSMLGAGAKSPDSSGNSVADSRFSRESRLPPRNLKRKPHHRRANTMMELHTTQARRVYSLDEKHFLQRGSRVVNTPSVWGAVVYAGVETKLYQNQRPPPSKMSSIDKRANVIIGVIFVAHLVMIAFEGAWATAIQNRVRRTHWYLADTEAADPWFWLKSVLKFYVANSMFIPISLFVSLEMVRFLKARIMERDKKMKDNSAGKNGFVVCKTSNLNEELGRVDVCFCDKTGTLTENNMVFQRCMVGLNRFRVNEDLSLRIADKRTEEIEPRQFQLFMLCLTLCNSVVPERSRGRRGSIELTESEIMSARTDSKRLSMHRPRSNSLTSLEISRVGQLIEYQSPNPDETAIIEFCRANEYVMVNRSISEISVNVSRAKFMNFKILATLEFSSERRRMTVIVRDQTDKSIYVFTKGSDAVVMGLADREFDTETYDACEEAAHVYAKKGLRTLVAGYKKLQPDEFTSWKFRYAAAASAMVDRESRLDSTCREIEQGLILLGVTAVEDKLQVGVPDTIQTLIESGITVWVLTGDKQETAVNIGFASKLVKPEAPMVYLNDSNPSKVLADLEAGVRLGKAGQAKLKQIESKLADDEETGEKAADQPASMHKSAVSTRLLFARQFLPTLVIDGNSLSAAIMFHQDKLLELTTLCNSVIATRVSPLQKAEIVSLVRKVQKKVTLAIGDGANDVTMIQAAHVGIGLVGQEGMQAARAADFSVAQFRFLARLITIHGRYNLLGVGKMIQYSLYKNFVVTWPQVYYAFYSLFSSVTVFSPWVLQMYNTLFTFFPIVCVALMYHDISPDNIRKRPYLYSLMKKGCGYLGIASTLRWFFYSILHSAIIFFFTVGLTGADDKLPGGHTGGMKTLGVVLSVCVFTVVTAKIIIETPAWTYMHIIAVVLSYLGFYSVLIFLTSNQQVIIELSGVWSELTNSNWFYATSFFVISAALFVDVLEDPIRRLLCPSDHMIVQVVVRREKEVARERAQKILALQVGNEFTAEEADVEEVELVVESNEKVDSRIRST